jgi:hypothetical protein
MIPQEEGPALMLVNDAEIEWVVDFDLRAGGKAFSIARRACGGIEVISCQGFE